MSREAPGVLLVDGEDAGRRQLRQTLALSPRRLVVFEAAETRTMLALAQQASLVLLDADRTDVEMVDALSLLRERHPDLPVIVVSARHAPDRMREAMEMGAASYARKQGPAERLLRVIEATLDGHPMLEADLVRPSIYRYEALLEGARSRDRAIIESLAAAVEAKDSVTSRHVRAVANLALDLAGLVDRRLADSEDFLFGCLLHDIGKIGVPERILTKAGPLTPAEWEIMQLHPVTGERVIRPLGLAPMVTDIVLYHHERWDGTGYPTGLAGEGIPLAARIFSVGDALEAMTASRPYRAALSAHEAVERVQAESGRQFDPMVVAALRRGVARGQIRLSDSAGRVPITG